MIATKRSIEMYKKRMTKEYFILARISRAWKKNFSTVKRKVTKGGGRKRKEARLERKLNKFGFKKE